MLWITCSSGKGNEEGGKGGDVGFSLLRSSSFQEQGRVQISSRTLSSLFSCFLVPFHVAPSSFLVFFFFIRLRLHLHFLFSWNSQPLVVHQWIQVQKEATLIYLNTFEWTCEELDIISQNILSMDLNTNETNEYAPPAVLVQFRCSFHLFKCSSSLPLTWISQTEHQIM